MKLYNSIFKIALLLGLFIGGVVNAKSIPLKRGWNLISGDLNLTNLSQDIRIVWELMR